MNNQTLITAGVALLEQIDAHTSTDAGSTAVSQPTHTSHKTNGRFPCYNRENKKMTEGQKG
jgi:hypothetical protein